MRYTLAGLDTSLYGDAKVVDRDSQETCIRDLFSNTQGIARVVANDKTKTTALIITDVEEQENEIQDDEYVVYERILPTQVCKTAFIHLNRFTVAPLNWERFPVTPKIDFGDITGTCFFPGVSGRSVIVSRPMTKRKVLDTLFPLQPNCTTWYTEQDFNQYYPCLIPFARTLDTDQQWDYFSMGEIRVYSFHMTLVEE